VARKRQADTDRCGPLREAVERLDAQIRSIEEDLDEPELPADLRRRLEAMLKRLRAQLTRLQEELDRCEALPVRRPARR
jgi:hypothetical protein